MSIFSKGNDMQKKDTAKVPIVKKGPSSSNFNAGSMQKTEQHGREGAAVKILGSGCPKCNQLEKATAAALAQLGMETEIEHVRDFAAIASYGVMTTPALVVDGKVLSYGKVLKSEEVMKLLQKARG